MIEVTSKKHHKQRTINRQGMQHLFNLRWLIRLLIGVGAGLAAVVHVQAQVPTNPYDYTRAVAFERDPATGWVTAEVVEPNNPLLCLRTEYLYDSYGNRRQTTQRHCAGTVGTAQIETRVQVADHVAEGSTPAGLAPTVITNPAGHIERQQVDTRHGGLSRLQDSDSLITEIVYDDFGRKTLEVRPDGNRTVWTYRFCAAIGGSDACPSASGAGGALVAYYVRTSLQNATGLANGPVDTAYFDTEGREVRTDTEAYATGSMRTKVLVKEYDALGRHVRQTGPFFDGDSALEWAEWRHDELGRITEGTRPNPNAANGLARTTTTYQGRVVVQTNALNQTQTKERDEYDRVIRVTDTQGNQISYQHDAFGNPVVTRDSSGNVVTISYDLRGRKVAMSDPDMGGWTYEFDVLGQLVRQVNPKNLATVFTYDPLGRMRRRLEADLDSRWYFDVRADGGACGASIGALCEATTTTGYRRVNTHDGFGRLVRTATTLASGANGTYVSKIVYDPNGRVAQQVWPTGLGVQYSYNPQGVLLEMRNAASQALYWQRQESNARGQLVRVLMGSGLVSQGVWQPETGLVSSLQAGPSGAAASVINVSYSYNALNNLTARSDAHSGVTESFGYDRLNRLTTQGVASAAGNRSVSYRYDALGNITYNSDVGLYDYAPEPGSTGPSRPHAVRRITGQAGKLTNPAYSYDANGNVERVVGNNGVVRTHAWTSFDMPESLALNARGVSSSFLYGPDHQRIRQTITRDGQTRTIHYLHPDNEGGLYFEREEQGTGGVATNRHFLSAEKGAFLQIETPGALQAEPVASDLIGLQHRYWHKDHLGSIVAITEGSGAVMERLAYEPFGKRRHANGQFDSTGEVDATRTKRGFTGHEHLDEVDYVHMNGRIYDPDIGRFLSADPTVPHYLDLQSFNRYSYTRNNPLNLIDPSGFDDKGESSDGSTGGKGGDGKGDGAEGPSAKEGNPEEADTLGAATKMGPTPARAEIPGQTPAGQASISTPAPAEDNSVLGMLGRFLHKMEVDWKVPSVASGPVLGAAKAMAMFGFLGKISKAEKAEDVAATVGRTLKKSDHIPAVQQVVVTGTRTERGPIVGGGATLGKLTPAEMKRIQNAANRSGTEISVVGSRVNPKKALRADSDYDYVVNANNKTRSDLKGSLPGAKSVKNGEASNLDVFSEPLDASRPHVTFTPR